MKSLFKTVALITFFSVLTRICGFFFRIYLSRTIGAESLGLYQVAFSIFMVLLTIVSSGLPLIISRMTAKFRAKGESKSEGSLVTVSLIFSVILSVILCLVVLLFKNVFASLFTDSRCIGILIVLLPSLVFSSVYSVFRGALWGQNNYFALCFSELYEQIVRIFICVIIIGGTLTAIENATSVAWSLTIACLMSMIFVILLFFFFGGKMSKPSKDIFKPLVKQSTPITGIRVAGSLIQPIIALIIPARLSAIGYTASQALSIYGVAVGMTMPLLFVPTTIIGSLSTALIPDMSAAMAQNDNEHIKRRVRSSIIFSLFISCLFVPAYLALGEGAGLFLYDNALSGTLLQASAWVLIPLGITNITSALLNSLGLEIKGFINYFVGAIVMFIAIWFLPSLVGINALVWGMGASFIVTAVLNSLMLKRKIKVHLNILKPLAIMILLIIPSAALTSFISSLCSHVFPLFVSLAIGGIVSVVSFVLLCNVFDVINLHSFIILAREKIKPKNSKLFKIKKLFTKKR